MKRRRIEVDEETERDGHEDAAEPERMEDRHRVEDAVRTVEIDAREHLRVVRVKVFIAEDDALRRALRAGCEEDHGGFLRGPRRHRV
ncbi:hypothetical protein SDC9_186931 [bioreactor metagenome]|uniref:Uncharacterized protein n=1 Tax=bioreactor metagenome TaxID=1076179 RepID=A0A645HVL3_9ZZZZ